MANTYLGEYEISLNEIDYTLKLTTGVIRQYKDAVGECLYAAAYRAVNAMVEAEQHKDNLSKYGEILTKAVSLDDAATLVWLAAKENNSQVDFGEIQEAFMIDHSLQDHRFHPAIFTTLALFALNGPEVKKKDNSKHG